MRTYTLIRILIPYFLTNCQSSKINHRIINPLNLHAVQSSSLGFVHTLSQILLPRLNILTSIFCQGFPYFSKNIQIFYSILSQSNTIKYIIMQKEEEIINKGSFQKESKPLQAIVVNKEREKAYDQKVESRWKAERSDFFQHQIKQKLSQTRITQKHQMRIAQLFMEIRQNKCYQDLDIGFAKNGDFREYKQQIAELNKSFGSMNEQFSQILKENPLISQIIRLQLTSLTIIDIQYDLNIQRQCPYQIQAFEIFKVVHENKGLSSVTIKGVKVKSFKKFIEGVALIRLNQVQEQDIEEDCKWMKDFKPSQSLKLAVDVSDEFYLSNSEKDVYAMKNLAQFGGMFQQLGIISVQIVNKYQLWSSIGRQGFAFQNLFKQLTLMRTIRIKVKIQQKLGYFYPHQPLMTILQMLSSLTTIAQLELKYIALSDQISINHYLAMEQVLITIFQNNPITHLQLNKCQNIPIFPTITTLESISLHNVSFRRQFNFLSNLTNSNQSLKAITYSLMDQQWSIEEQIFNRLQRFQIINCNNLILEIQNHSPSNIKCLKIGNSIISNVDCLSVLFPKLIHISQLSLYLIDCGRQLICTIPSPHLVVLIIKSNKQFANKDLEAIDKKWPKLRQLTLRSCPNVNEDGWRVCQFKGLINLQIEDSIQKHGPSILKQLRRRGIKVY